MILTKLNTTGTSCLLLKSDDNENIAVIICDGRSQNITQEVKRAIKDHYTASEVKIEAGRTVTRETSALFDAETIEDGIECLRGFELEVIASY